MNLACADTEHVSPEPLRVQVTRVIKGVAVLAVPFPPIDIEAETILHKKVAVPHPGHQRLRFDPISGALYPSTNNCFISGSANRDQLPGSGLHATRRENAQPLDLSWRKESEVKRGFHRRDRILLIETMDGAP